MKIYNAVCQILAVALCVFATGCGYLALTTPEPAALLESNLQNVVSVTTDSGYCSGWVKTDTHEIVTAAHCGDGTSSQIFDVDFGDGVKHHFHIKYLGDESLTAATDIMVLYTTSEEQHKIKWPKGFNLCNFKPYYGEEVELYGGPLGRAKSIFFGRIGNPDVDISAMLGKAPFTSHMVEYDGEMFPGNSGGPAIDIRHNCVMGSAEVVQREDHGLGTSSWGVNFFIPGSDIEKVVV